MTDKQLKDEARSYHQLIYDVGCYGVRDMIFYSRVVDELIKRGYSIGEQNRLVIKK